MQRMLHGVLVPGTTQFDEGLWSSDALLECHNDDALWGFTVRLSEELRVKPAGRLDDDVLYRLIRMGIEDWEEPNFRHPGSIQSMRHATTLSSRILQRIFSFEDQVGEVCGDQLRSPRLTSID